MTTLLDLDPMAVSSNLQRAPTAATGREVPTPPPPEVAKAPKLSRPTFEQLVVRQLDFVWRSLRRFGVPAGDVDDATQQVFLVANEKFEQIRPGRERPFLVGVATRVASHARRAHMRRESAEQRLSEDAEAPARPNPNPEELTEKMQARELLDRVLDGMPDELRAVFALFELEELSVDQIAIALDIPRGTAATRLRRSRQVFHEQAQRLKAQIEATGGRA